MKKLYLFLFVATLLVYSQVSSFAFTLCIDDTQGLLGNPQVRDGLESRTASSGRSPPLTPPTGSR